MNSTPFMAQVIAQALTEGLVMTTPGFALIAPLSPSQKLAAILRDSAARRRKVAAGMSRRGNSDSARQRRLALSEETAADLLEEFGDFADSHASEAEKDALAGARMVLIEREESAS